MSTTATTAIHRSNSSATVTNMTFEGSWSKKLPLISDDVFRIIQIILPIFLFTITSLFGIAVNIANIIVFKKQGLQESIILGFFTLSISDLILAACPLGVAACESAHIIWPGHPIYFIGLHFVSTGNLREMAYFFSNVLTALLSIERCCCVVLPFKVKAIFTLSNSRAIIIALFLLVVLGYAPTFSTVQLRWMPSAGINDSKILTVWLAPHRPEVHSYSFYVTGILTPTISLCFVICATSIMVYGLQASSKFRQEATTMTETSKQGKTTFSSRDARLVKVMVFLGAIFAVCNLPYVLLVYVLYIEPELEFGSTYHNTYVILYELCYLLSSINSSANTFVYYKNSSRYKEIFDKTFSCIIR